MNGENTEFPTKKLDPPKSPIRQQKRQPPKKRPNIILMQLVDFMLFAFKFPRSGLVQLVVKVLFGW
jgi:hypothetical protein